MKYSALILITLLIACEKKTEEIEARLEAKTADQKVEAPEASANVPTYTKITQDKVGEIISTVKINRAGEGMVDGLRLLEVTPLAHESFQGPLGPAKDAIVFFDQREGSDMNVMGWVIGTDAGEVKAWRFAHQTGSIDEIKAVFFEDVYKDGFQDVLVTFSYMTGMGAQGAEPQTETVAFTYEKGIDQFVAHDDLFDKPAETAADARAALRAKGLIK